MKKYNFKQIFALGTSALLIGMTAMVGAANYPAPFVAGGNSNVAIVYGTGSGVSSLDLVQAGNIQSSLQSFMGSGDGTSDLSTSGETVAIFGNDKIWLNTSLNAGALQTVTKTNLPTVLGDYTFSGNVEKKLTSTIKLLAGATAGGDNSGKVLFTKQPSTSNDPIIGLSLGTSATSNALYNASVTFGAINFTHADSEGEEIELFGQKFTVASATSTTDLVLLKGAEKISLSSDSPTTTTEISGNTYTIELISASDTAATIQVTDSNGETNSKEINEAASKKVGGITIAVQTADETNLKLTATIIVGAEKLTFVAGSSVTSGDTGDSIDGTMVYMVGTPTAMTELAVAVFAPETQDDIVLPGEPFVDPVFGSFKVDFVGLTSNIDDTATREVISVSGGQQAAELTMTDSDGNTKTFDFAYNGTYATDYASTPVRKPANLRLAEQNNFSIFVHEGANVTENDYFMVGNEDYGHLLQVTRIYNASNDYTKDDFKVKDVFDGTVYEATFTSIGEGTISIDGKTYGVQRVGSGDTGYATVKYPISDSSTNNTFVFYPTIETSKGALVALYEPLNFNVSAVNGTIQVGAATVINLPDGDGYTPVTFTYVKEDGEDYVWGVTGASASSNALNLSTGLNALANYTVLTVGEFRYNLTSASENTTYANSINRTMIYLLNPEDKITNLAEPSVMIFEGKDKNSAYHGLVINLETAPAGTSTDPLGVDDVLFTQEGEEYHSGSKTLSGTDLTMQMDYWGTITTEDASTSSQKEVTVSYPGSQVNALIYVGEVDSSISGGSIGGATALGDVLVKDSEVSSVSSKNLIVIGGSCINSVAATLVGGAKCGSSWTDATGVGSGQFLIQSFGDAYTTGKIALLVAGYDVADTVNAATYLKTQTVDTTAAKKYIGTTSTQATLQVA